MGMLIWAGLALTDPSTEPQTDFAVYVDNNQIVATGLRSELQNRYPEAQQVGGDHLLLLPALVNSHDHGRALGTASLGIADDLLEIWLPQLWSQPVIDPYLAAAYDGLQLLQSGVGTVAHSHNPRDWHTMSAEAEATLRGYRDAGIRVAFHPPLIDQNSLVYDSLDKFLAELPQSVWQMAQPFWQVDLPSHAEYFDLCAELYNTYHDPDQHTVHIQVSPAGGQWCSDELISTAVEFAQQHQTRVQMHLLETRYQRHYAYRRWDKSFEQHLEEIEALGPWLTLAHMVWTDETDLPLLADRGVGIAHNPSSNLRLRSGIAPVTKMKQAGLRVGIGLDGHGLDDDQDYLREMRLAWSLANQPGVGASASTIPAQTIWRMGTIDGAAITLGPTVPLGRLAVGYLADLVLIDWQAASGLWQPPLSQVSDLLLHRATRHYVTHVMVNGQWVIQNGQSTTLDATAITAAIREELRHQNSSEQQQMAHAAHSLAPHLRRFYAQWD